VSTLPETTPSIDAERAAPGGFYSWYVIIVLMLCYTLAQVDNSLPSILVEAIKADLNLTDTQVGLITGPAFAITYAICAVPIAKLSDRLVRTKVIAAAIVVWSGFTAMAGVANSFGTLAFSRVGLAVGESALTPAAHSIISDHTTPAKRPIAMAVYALGAAVGGGLALALGGVISDAYGWRTAFLWVGLGGAFLTLLVLLTVKEPARRSDDPMAELPKGDLKSLFRAAAIRNIILGGTISMLSVGALNNWAPAYIMRTFNLSASETGASFGGLMGVLGLSGLLLGGFVASWFASRRPGNTFRILALLLAISTVTQIASFLVTSYALFLAFTAVSILCIGFYFAPTFSAIQSLVDPRARAFAAAVTLFCISAVGMGLGTSLAGLLSDLLNPHFGADSLRWALLIVTVVRFWGAGHYFLASRALDRGRAADPVPA
jgi:predicted MFS family arabinose efflux permease